MEPEKIQEAILNKTAENTQHLEAIHALSGESGDKLDTLVNGIKDLGNKINSHKVEISEFPKYPDFPEIKLPKINVPEIKIPEIKIPKIELPKIVVPKPNIIVEPTPVKFPKEMKVDGLKEATQDIIDAIPEKYSVFEEVSREKPIPIMVVDALGKQVSNFGGEFSAPHIVALKFNGKEVNQDNPIPVANNGTPRYDYIGVNVSGATSDVYTFKSGGASGSTVQTTTINYTDSTKGTLSNVAIS